MNHLPLNFPKKLKKFWSGYLVKNGSRVERGFVPTMTPPTVLYIKGGNPRSTPGVKFINPRRGGVVIERL